ncbi:MAG TPA: C25 family peptidase propeptide domain-containing protein, partial [Candidatus Cloacimonadota bacterium]|nr:C25 family peptidase propeptide domain-containing protein [Candidatus Cloacimonadota bacterium]
MKKLTLVLLGLWVAMIFAGTVDSGPQSMNHAFKINSKSLSGMDLSFQVPEFEITTETVGNKTYQRLNLPGAGSLMQSGMPELPTVSANIAIPARGSVSIVATGATERVINQYLAYPLQQGAELDSPKGFVLNAQYYSEGALYPEAAIEYSDPQILRDFRIVTVQINPFSYNAQTGELIVRETVNFRINYNSSPGINELVSEPTQISSAFAKLYEGVILNFADYRSFL